MKRFFLLALCAIISLATWAQSADQILDNTARMLNNGGIRASFTISGSVNMNGNIQLKGNKFILSTPRTDTWYDGRTEWSYLKANKEVNVSTPTAKQIQNLNPYTYINGYRSAFLARMAGKQGCNYNINLVPRSTRYGVKNVQLIISRNYQPRKIIVTQSNGKRQTITVKSFSSGQKYPDSMFTFNKKRYPKAEIIDLR